MSKRRHLDDVKFGRSKWIPNELRRVHLFDPSIASITSNMERNQETLKGGSWKL
jgi:hypothetical protein